VKGHAAHPENNRCDEIANIAAASKFILLIGNLDNATNPCACPKSDLESLSSLCVTYRSRLSPSGPSRKTLRSEAGQRLGLILKGGNNVWQADYPPNSLYPTTRTEQFHGTALTAIGVRMIIVDAA
jgi:hypothetical protein